MHRMRKIVFRPASRSGIALVIVLGFLSVLVLMGVSFAVLMRTERIAARSYVDVVKAKQLARAGLARAMSDLDEDLLASNAVYPDWLFLASTGSDPAAGMADTEEPKTLIPQALWMGPTNVFISTQSNYRDITDPQTGQTIGRYAYAIFNCSGLLDAGIMGGGIRSNGVSSREIQFYRSIVGDEATNYTANWFGQRSNKWIRFETGADLDAITYSNVVAGRQQYPSNFFVYSRATPGWLDNAGELRDTVYIGGTAAELIADQNAINSNLNSMTSMGAPAVDAGFLLNLLDYVDADDIPGNGLGGQNLNSYATEMVPMINEVVVTNWWDDAGPYSNAFQVSVEVWYPFSQTNNNNFTLSFGAAYEGVIPASLNPGNATAVNIPLPGPWTNGKRMVVSTTRPYVTQSPTGGVDVAGARVRYFARISQGPSQVDQTGFNPFVTYLNMGDLLGSPGTWRRSKQVIDPRINWNGNDTTQWVTNNTHSMDAINPIAQSTWMNTGAGADGDSLMYVRNGPLEMTGELGMLLYDATKPWTTIRLLNPNAHPVLSMFTTDTGTVYRGCINVNSDMLPVLASAFASNLVERWPGETGGPTNDASDSLAIATALISAGPYTNFSEIAKVGGASATLPGYSLIQSEGIIRKTAGLLTTRQQIFAVIVKSNAYDAKGGISAEQKVFAIIWRDPFPGPDGRHQMFIRYFKWLTSLT